MQLLVNNYQKILKTTAAKSENEEVKETTGATVFNDGALYVFRIGKVPYEISRDRLIEGITKACGKLVKLQLMAKVKTQYFECYFSFASIKDAQKLLTKTTKTIDCGTHRLYYELHDRNYIFMD